MKVVSLAWFEQCLHTQGAATAWSALPNPRGTDRRASAAATVCLDEARFPVVDKDASGERVRLCLPGAALRPLARHVTR